MSEGVRASSNGFERYHKRKKTPTCRDGELLKEIVGRLWSCLASLWLGFCVGQTKCVC